MELSYLYPRYCRELCHLYPMYYRESFHLYPMYCRELSHLYPMYYRELSYLYPRYFMELSYLYPRYCRELSHLYPMYYRELFHLYPIQRSKCSIRHYLPMNKVTYIHVCNRTGCQTSNVCHKIQIFSSSSRDRALACTGGVKLGAHLHVGRAVQPYTVQFQVNVSTPDDTSATRTTNHVAGHAQANQSVQAKILSIPTHANGPRAASNPSHPPHRCALG